MKKEGNLPQKFESLTDFHRVFGLPKPLHPMISFIDIKNIRILSNELSSSFMLNFYKISYKTNLCGKANMDKIIMTLVKAAWYLQHQTKYLKVLMTL